MLRLFKPRENNMSILHRSVIRIDSIHIQLNRNTIFNGEPAEKYVYRDELNEMIYDVIKESRRLQEELYERTPERWNLENPSLVAESNEWHSGNGSQTVITLPGPRGEGEIIRHVLVILVNWRGMEVIEYHQQSNWDITTELTEQDLGMA